MEKRIIRPKNGKPKENAKEKKERIGALQGRKCWQRKAGGEGEGEKGEIGNHKKRKAHL